jgi:hypothetical protein
MFNCKSGGIEPRQLRAGGWAGPFDVIGATLSATNRMLPASHLAFEHLRTTASLSDARPRRSPEPVRKLYAVFTYQPISLLSTT